VRAHLVQRRRVMFASSSRALVSTWIESIHAHQVPAWALLQCVAIVSMVAFFVWRTRSGDRRLRPLLLLALPGAGVGALTLGLLLRIPAWVASGFDTKHLFGLGVMAYGALLGLVGAFAALTKLRKMDVADALDRLAPALGLLVLFGRTGCFFAGCDFGITGAIPWAIRYPQKTAAFLAHASRGWIPPSAEHSLAVHPAQLYEAAVGFVMVLVGLWIERRQQRKGAVLAAVAATYAIGRFGADLFRGDERPMLAVLSFPQWMSIAVLGWVIAWKLERTREVNGYAAR
jgi:phosphatidylglycerol:prolipoprotein diacylglycerol transferase